MHRLIHTLPPLAAVSALLGVILWDARRIRRAAIAEATRLGLDTSPVDRVILFSVEQTMRRLRCVRSRVALPERQMVSTRSWRLIQRPGARHPDLPVGWRVEGLPVPLPPSIRAAFAAVATQCKDRLFEIEGTPHEVCVYWDSLGGASEARAVRAHLDRVVDAIGEASLSSTA